MLTLDYDQGDLSAQLAPRPDDLAVANVVTAGRRDGGEETAERTSGPLSTDDPPDGIGEQEKSDTFAVEADGRLSGIASWWLRSSTWDEARYPAIPHEVRPLREALVADAVELDVGDRLVFQNVPGTFGDVDQLTLGYSETLGEVSWRQSWHTTPAGPFAIFTLGDDVFGRLDTAGSELAAGVDASATELLVATDSGKTRWTTDAERPSDFPFALTLGGGETVKVTAISGTTSPQTFSVERSVNGISRSWPAGTRLRIARVAVA